MVKESSKLKSRNILNPISINTKSIETEEKELDTIKRIKKSIKKTQIRKRANTPHDLLNQYFKKDLISDLAKGLCGDRSPYIRQLQLMFKSNKLIQKAINSNIKVAIRKPEYIKIQSTKPVLVLDLDETLIHSYYGAIQADLPKISFVNKENKKIEMSVAVRPYLNQFLKEVSQNFTLVLFTSSEQCYAERCLDIIDPQKTFFKHRFYKESCVILNNKLYLKDLRLFKLISHRNIFIVDNNPFAYIFHLKNAFPIISFLGDREDKELLKLSKTLKLFSIFPNKHKILEGLFGKNMILEAPTYDGLLKEVRKELN